MAFGGIETDLAKAKGVPAGVTTRDMASIVNAMAGVLERDRRRANRTAPAGFGGVPLPRPLAWRNDEFGPDWPLPPEPLDPARRDTGQAQPRLTEYDVAWNLQYGKEAHVPWRTLKRASETPLFRACIELRKTELATMDWQIRVSPVAAAKLATQQARSKGDVTDELQKKYQDEIDRLTDFWQIPDRKNGRNFGEWISIALDEQLTWDALAIYPRMTYGGDLLDLWIIDGSTIMPLRDETGGRPEGDAPAYQQILYGFPRGEYTAQTLKREDGSVVTPGALLASQLIYRRRTPRADTPYGYSATEQALMDGLLYNKRFQWMIAEYTEGVMPTQFIESDGSLDWTPTQVLDYERDFNNRLAGQTSERYRAPFLPPGMRAAAMAQVGERYKSDYDLHLIKLVAMHFGLTVTELGFTETGGLGSTGYHEGQEDINFRRGRLPDLKWFGELCTEISQSHLQMPPELEFAFLGLDDEDEAAADLLDHQRLADGRMTLNQAVTKLGLPPLPYKEANMSMIQTQRGVIFLQGASEQVPPGTMIEPASERDDIDPATGKPTGNVKPGGTTAPKAAVKPTAKDAELAAYRKWLAKGERNRPFRFEHWDQAEAELALWTEDLNKAAKQAPKAGGPAGQLPPSSSPYGDQL